MINKNWYKTKYIFYSNIKNKQINNKKNTHLTKMNIKTKYSKIKAI